MNDKEKNLLESVETGDTNTFKKILKGGSLFFRKKVDLNLKNPDNKVLLHLAIEKGYNEIAELLIKNGADVNAKHSLGGYNMLFLALFHRHQMDIAELMIKYGANINIPVIDNYTPLNYALREGKIDLAKWLLDKGADVNKPNHDDETPLSIAIQNKNIAAVEWLITNGADINKMDKYGNSPLILALIYLDNLNVFKLLIEEGADIFLSDKTGKTILQIVLDKHYKSDFIELAKILINKGVELNTNNNYDTPLMIAVKNNLREIAELLIERKADINTKDADGFTPVMYAKAKKYDEILNLLLTNGAVTLENTTNEKIEVERLIKINTTNEFELQKMEVFIAANSWSSSAIEKLALNACSTNVVIAALKLNPDKELISKAIKRYYADQNEVFSIISNCVQDNEQLIDIALETRSKAVRNLALQNCISEKEILHLLIDCQDTSELDSLEKISNTDELRTFFQTCKKKIETMEYISMSLMPQTVLAVLEKLSTMEWNDRDMEDAKQTIILYWQKWAPNVVTENDNYSLQKQLSIIRQLPATHQQVIYSRCKDQMNNLLNWCYNNINSFGGSNASSGWGYLEEIFTLLDPGFKKL